MAQLKKKNLPYPSIGKWQKNYYESQDQRAKRLNISKESLKELDDFNQKVHKAYQSGLQNIYYRGNSIVKQVVKEFQKPPVKDKNTLSQKLIEIANDIKSLPPEVTIKNTGASGYYSNKLDSFLYKAIYEIAADPKEIKKYQDLVAEKKTLLNKLEREQTRNKAELNKVKLEEKKKKLAEQAKKRAAEQAKKEKEEKLRQAEIKKIELAEKILAAVSGGEKIVIGDKEISV